MDSSVQMTVRWYVPPQEAGPITAALHALMVEARAERGCLGCRLATEMGDRVGLEYVEEWREEADLKRQILSARFARLAELMERATERPRIEFRLPAGVRGLDYAEEVRLRPGGLP